MGVSKQSATKALAAAALVVGGGAQAAIWTGAGDGTWASGPNWSTDATVTGDTTPPGQNGTATFNGAGSTITVGADQAISKMVFGQSGSVWNINGSGKLTLHSFDYTPFDTGNNSNAGGDQAAALTIADNSIVTVSNAFSSYSHWDGGRTQVDIGTGSTLRLNGALSGSKWTTKKGAGTLEFNNPSGSLPSLEVSAGTVKVLGSASPLPSNAQLTVGAGATVDIQSTNVAVGALSLSAGSMITNTGATRRTLSTSSWGNQGIAGEITGNLNVSWRADDKTTTISAPQTYVGSTTVASRMVLLVTNLTGSATGTGTVTIQDNAVLAGTGSVAGVVTFNVDTISDTNTYGAILRPGSATDYLSLGGISGASGAALDLVNMTALSASTSYMIVTYGGPAISGFGTTLNQPVTHNVSYATPGEIWLVPVPEPGAVAFGLAATTLLSVRRRRATF